VVGPILAAALADERWLQITPVLISGGKSNLTFELVSDAGSLILRRPPLGAILQSAHDMGREARVQAALRAGTPVPVPRIVYADLEGRVTGTPFYVMEKVEGHVIRDELPPGFAASSADRVALADGLIDVLVALHEVDPVAVGLADYGRPVGFVERQIGRWMAQWERSKAQDLPAIDELARRLRRALPQSAARACIVHGDFRLDNCLMDRDAPGRVAAVLDWELATLGDPMTDLGMLLFYWCEPGEPAPLLTPAITQQPGFPQRSHLAERYITATGANPEQLGFFEGFAHFKFAVIAQGIAARVSAGAMAGQEFGDIEAEVARIAAAGLARMRDSR
jgi:aminoglycoside phosphotransferase (APT) family kinase protein